MKKSPRYSTFHLPEAQFEPGSHGHVLKNLIHITGKREMDVLEAERYALVQPKLMVMFTKDHRFTAADICAIHRAWLRDVYEWRVDTGR